MAPDKDVDADSRFISLAHVYGKPSHLKGERGTGLRGTAP